DIDAMRTSELAERDYSDLALRRDIDNRYGVAPGAGIRHPHHAVVGDVNQCAVGREHHLMRMFSDRHCGDRLARGREETQSACAFEDDEINRFGDQAECKQQRDSDNTHGALTSGYRYGRNTAATR